MEEKNQELQRVRGEDGGRGGGEALKPPGQELLDEGVKLGAVLWARWA